MNPLQTRALAVPIELAVAACAPSALGLLQDWIERGATPRPTVQIRFCAGRVLATVDFDQPVGQCNGLVLPLQAPPAGDVATADLARVRAGDHLADQLRAELLR